MGKRAVKGWRFNSTSNKFDYSVYNSAGAIKPVFDEDGTLYQKGTEITATAAELNALHSVFDEDGTLYQKGIEITATAAELNALHLTATNAVRKIKILPVSVAGAGTEKDSGWALPAKAIVLDVFVDVKTAATDGTKTIDVGTLSSGSGVADGYIDGGSVAITGIVKGSLATAGATKGALLKEEQTVGQETCYSPSPDVASGGKNISYTLGASVTGLVADIIIDYIEIA